MLTPLFHETEPTAVIASDRFDNSLVYFFFDAEKEPDVALEQLIVAIAIHQTHH